MSPFIYKKKIKHLQQIPICYYIKMHWKMELIRLSLKILKDIQEQAVIQISAE